MFFIPSLFATAVQLGYTALHRACAQGHLDVVAVLLSANCPVNRPDEVCQTAAKTCKIYQKCAKTAKIVKMLSTFLRCNSYRMICRVYNCCREFASFCQFQGTVHSRLDLVPTYIITFPVGRKLECCNQSLAPCWNLGSVVRE